MEFRTIVDIPKPSFQIEPLEEMLFVGSCFADSIGQRFVEEQFRATVNPYGVMYNPASVLHTVERWLSLQSEDEGGRLPRITFITLGTNHVYRLKETGEIVDNCQKRPAVLFQEEQLSVDECADYLRRTVDLLRSRRPDAQVVFTVSPIRYRKYGYHESQLSKATLLLAVNKVIALHHPQSTIHHPPSTIHHPQSTIHNPQSTIHNPQSTIHHPRVLLGTATPSMESYHNAMIGKYGYVQLTQRHAGIELPEIQVVDTKDLQHRKMMHGPFSPLLLARVREALERGEQAILFQNRRGYAPMIECKHCGWVPHCQNCDVSLTLHRQMNQLVCHYCGAVYQVPVECPACGGTELQTRGYGTEKIEADVRDIFPEARISRMDLDTTRTRNAYERLISDFGSGRTNLLIGTQMISKGLDFDKVSVVGILNADTMLNYPDFRAFEHAYMMMSQVSGRAGRKGRRGLVILQTRQPNLPIIQQVVRGDYPALYHSLCAERQQFHYPPFYRLIDVYLKHRSEELTEVAAQELGFRLRQWFGGRVLGPDKPGISRVKSLSIRKLILKLEPQLNMAEVRKYLALAQQQMLQDKRYSSLQVYYDVDPL